MDFFVLKYLNRREILKKGCLCKFRFSVVYMYLGSYFRIKIWLIKRRKFYGYKGCIYL